MDKIFCYVQKYHKERIFALFKVVQVAQYWHPQFCCLRQKLVLSLCVDVAWMLLNEMMAVLQ